MQANRRSVAYTVFSQLNSGGVYFKFCPVHESGVYLKPAFKRGPAFIYEVLFCFILLSSFIVTLPPRYRKNGRHRTMFSQEPRLLV